MCCKLYVVVDIFCFRQKTAYEMRISYWSSNVCSSDLGRGPDGMEGAVQAEPGVDVAREIVGRGDNRLQRCPHEGVAMFLAPGEGACITPQEGKVGREVDRKSGVLGKGGSVRFYFGGRGDHKNKKTLTPFTQS